jgi:hypothetical protein
MKKNDPMNWCFMENVIKERLAILIERAGLCTARAN